MNYRFGGISLQNGRQSNMDSLLLKSGRIGDKDILLAVVCDGVGSLADGAYASGLAVNMLNDWFEGLTTTDRIGLGMRDAILNVNTKITTDARRKNIHTASTLSALLLVEDVYYIAHIGDSRIYSYSDGQLTCLTGDDHSESGKLLACIGKSERIVLQYSEGSAVGQAFIICSDGLYKRMDYEFMIAQMKSVKKRSINDLVETLTQYVIARGEKDNISVGIVKIED